MIDETNKTISITWSIEDVLLLAEDEEVTLIPEEAWNILKRAYEQHDCSYGLSWDRISECMDDYLREQREAD